jgi:DUF4097 and DUF4098 domain-containing protein YvlB
MVMMACMRTRTIAAVYLLCLAAASSACDIVTAEFKSQETSESADTRFRTVNGGVELLGLTGPVVAETTNGGISARDVGGPIEASTTNGGVDVELSQVSEPGVRLQCTNGGIRLRMPADARATISASVTNGGIDTGTLSLHKSESTRRRLEARLNGGGPMIKIGGTNGGVSISRR